MNLSYDENNIIVYVNNINNNIDFTNTNSIREYFKIIFLKLKNYYNIKLSGIYKVKVYKDFNIVIELFEEESDYYDEIDMEIELIENTFLYQIEDIFISKDIIKKSKILKYNNNLYLMIINKLTNKELGYLYEISKLIYKNTENIIKYSRELPLNLV